MVKRLTLLLFVWACCFQSTILLFGEEEIGVNGKKIYWYHFDSIDSTQIYAKENVKVDIERPNYWKLISADMQTAGIGSTGGAWIANNLGNIYMTLTFPIKKDDISLSIEHLFAVAIYKTIKKLLPDNYPIVIKRPNDIMVNGKKICGILGERKDINKDWHQVFIGIGINLCYSEEDLKKIDQPATSIFTEIGVKLDPKEVIKKVLDEAILLLDQKKSIDEKDFPFVDKVSFISVKNKG